MISVRSRRPTYLCLDDDSYTGFYTVLNWEGNPQLTLPCFVVYLLHQHYFTIFGLPPHFFHPYLCRRSRNEGYNVRFQNLRRLSLLFKSHKREIKINNSRISKWYSATLPACSSYEIQYSMWGLFFCGYRFYKIYFYRWSFFFHQILSGGAELFDSNMR